MNVTIELECIHRAFAHALLAFHHEAMVRCTRRCSLPRRNAFKLVVYVEESHFALPSKCEYIERLSVIKQ